MKKTEVYQIIDSEIKWCLEEKNRTMPEEYMDGFVAGLKQAKLLVKKLRLDEKVATI